MGFETLIRGLIKSVAVPLLGSMELTVMHYAWLGDDGRGNDTIDTVGVPRKALVDYTKKGMLRYTSTGVLIQELATLTFLEPVPSNGAKGRQEPIDLRDKIVLPSGPNELEATAPIQDTGGFADSGTGQPFVLTITLGTVMRGT